jgi:hypothetical protein
LVLTGTSLDWISTAFDITRYGIHAEGNNLIQYLFINYGWAGFGVFVLYEYGVVGSALAWIALMLKFIQSKNLRRTVAVAAIGYSCIIFLITFFLFLNNMSVYRLPPWFPQ